jgi:cilia- and flagella-associated protein 57
MRAQTLLTLHLLLHYHSGRFVAVAEAGERPSVYIYDLRTLRKRKNLQAPEGESREFISLGFSHDSQLLVTLGGAPTWYVLELV